MSISLMMLALFGLGVLLNALFAAYETGFLSCNSLRIRQLAEKEGNRNARHLSKYLEKPDYLLTVVLLATNISLIFGTLMITRLLGEFWATIVATPVFLVIGELVPKSMFRAHPTQAALIFVPAIRLADFLLTFVSWPIIWGYRAFLYLVGAPETQGLRMMMRSAEDMRVLVDVSADHGAIEEEEKEMIHSVMNLQSQSAKEVMVPRIDIQALSETATRTELVRLLKESGYTRLPVYRESIDEVVGVINAFDLLRDTTPENEDIHRFIRPILHVYDTMKLDDLLQLMRREKQFMAVVSDEYGGTDGLISLEDILEEIFGDIQDEYDEEESPIRQMGPNDFIVNARTPLEEAAGFMGLSMRDEDVETVGGWLMHAAGRIPQKGEVLRVNGFRVTVLDGTRNAVFRIRIEILSEKPARHEQEKDE